MISATPPPIPNSKPVGISLSPLPSSTQIEYSPLVEQVSPVPQQVYGFIHPSIDALSLHFDLSLQAGYHLSHFSMSGQSSNRIHKPVDSSRTNPVGHSHPAPLQSLQSGRGFLHVGTQLEVFAQSVYIATGSSQMGSVGAIDGHSDASIHLVFSSLKNRPLCQHLQSVMYRPGHSSPSETSRFRHEGPHAGVCIKSLDHGEPGHVPAPQIQQFSS